MGVPGKNPAVFALSNVHVCHGSKIDCGRSRCLTATAFLRYGDRAIVQMPPVPQGIFSMWWEERKTPPLDTDAPMITSKTIGDAEFLFIESGGFNANRPVGWKSPLMVMKRQ